MTKNIPQRLIKTVASRLHKSERDVENALKQLSDDDLAKLQERPDSWSAELMDWWFLND